MVNNKTNKQNEVTLKGILALQRLKESVVYRLANSRQQERKAAGKKPHYSGNTYKRRAEKYGCRYEPFNRNIVFDRDGWTCKICGCSVQKKNHKAKNAAELDHIYPMSKGGPHIIENTQTLCKQCNMRKFTSIPY